MPNTPAATAELAGVGTNTGYRLRWQDPDCPAPTLVTAPAAPGGAGWLLINWTELQHD